jgi:hypothetical protein
MAIGDPHTTPPQSAPVPSYRRAGAARLAEDERLACGRSVSDAWEQARDPAAPPDGHTAVCPYCQEAVHGLRELDAAARALKAERPSGRTVAERVMRAVRNEARLGRLLPLDDAAGDLRIAETAAAKVLRRVADGIPGVRAASCRLTAAAAGVEVAVEMTLAVSLDAPMPGRADDVRRAVHRAARRQLGIATSRVDLTVVSVLESLVPAPAAPGRGGG